MKKNLLSIFIICALFAAPVFSLEWGGVLNEEFRYTKTSSVPCNQSNAIYLWANTPVLDDFTFAAEGLFEYNLPFGNSAEPEFSYIADLDLFKINGNINVGSGKCALSAGRFTIADNTGVNFSQCCDGVSAVFSFSNLKFSVYGGYTGLLNNLNITINGADSETKDFYSCCHGYIPLLASVEIPSLFANQAIALQGEAFLDTASSNKYNRYYANLTLGGPIVGTTYYSFITSFGLVNKEFMNYSSLSIASYPNDKIAISGGASFASGDFGDGSLQPYTTFTYSSAYYSTAYPQITGCIVPNVSIIYTTGNLFANIAIKAPFDMPEKTPAFAGVEADVSFVYNIFSDLQSEIDVVYYKDIAGSGKYDNFIGTAKVVLSF